jgi:hypothetical protein
MCVCVCVCVCVCEGGSSYLGDKMWYEYYTIEGYFELVFFSLIPRNRQHYSGCNNFCGDSDTNYTFETEWPQ